MARSNSAITKTFLKEGKISYSNKDTGGLTYLGLSYNKWPNAEVWPEIFAIFQKVKPEISLGTLKSIGTSSGIQISLTDAEEDKINELCEPLRKKIIEFYKKQFWDILNADNILSQSFAESFFDFSVNVGSGTAAKILQKYLNVGQDGVIGKITISKLNSELLKNTYNVNIDFSILKIKRYGEIVKNNEKQMVNLHGWLNRCFEVFDDIYSIEIIINLRENFPDAIPEDLKGDISKLIDLYSLNKEYGSSRNQNKLVSLHKKIIETI